MLEKVKAFILKLNEFGVPLPLLRDPVKAQPSVSLTMVFIAFNMVLIGLIGKWSKILDIDVQSAIYWFYGCCALYFGRSFKSGNNKIE